MDVIEWSDISFTLDGQHLPTEPASLEYHTRGEYGMDLSSLIPREPKPIAFETTIPLATAGPRSAAARAVSCRISEATASAAVSRAARKSECPA